MAEQEHGKDKVAAQVPGLDQDEVWAVALDNCTFWL